MNTCRLFLNQLKTGLLGLVLICVGSVLFFQTAAAANLVIYGASGNFGSDIVTEALNRGHKVVGVSRTPEKLTVSHPNFTAVQGDVMDLDSMMKIVSGADAVIMSLRGNGSDNSAEQTVDYQGAATYTKALQKLGDKTPRLLMVGNQATLYSDGVLGFDNGVAQNRYAEGSAMYGRVKAHLLIIDLFQAEPKLQWTLFAPSGSIGPGERKGTYKIGDRQIKGRGTGISQKDFAIAFIDEVEKPTSIRKVISIGY